MNGPVIDKPSIFLLARHQPSFQEMFPVARALRAEGMYPVFLLEREVGEANVALCDREGIDKICLWRQEDTTNALSERKRLVTADGQVRAPLGHSIWKNTTGWAVRFLPVPRAFWSALKEIRQKRLLARLLIRRFSPSVILLSGDRHAGLELPLIKEANDSCIPTIVLPSAYSSHEGIVKYREQAAVYWVHQGSSRCINRLVKLLLPHQAYRTAGGREFLFYPAWWTLAAWISGILPQMPFYLGGGHTSIVAINGLEVKERYVSHGVDSKKLVITGQPAFDDLYRVFSERKRIREELTQKLHLNPQRKLLICALPHLGEHETISWERHWQETNSLVETLSRQNENIILSLHPKMEKEKYAYLSQKYPLTISEYPLSQILPVADVFIATFSSTVIWAILCQIPTIIVDLYDLNYQIWDEFRGCLIVRSREDFKKTLHRLLNDDEFYSQLQEYQHQSAETIAPFDGKAMDRIVHLIKQYLPRSNMLGH